MAEGATSGQQRRRRRADADPLQIVLARRALTIPAILLAFVLGIGLAPLWLPAAWLYDRLGRPRRQSLRCLLYLCWHLGCEIAGLTAVVVVRGIGLISPAGDAARHHRLETLWAGWLWAGASRLFRLQLEVEGGECLREGPCFLLLRHASIVDTLLAALIAQRPYGLRIRYVLKRELLWDPCLDIVGNRIPNHFVRRGSDESEHEIAAIAELARDIGAGEAVMIYPEGTRHTPEKQRRILERLAASGDSARLARARALEHVLPPRLGGTLALLEARPDVDVVFCAHTGLESITKLHDVIAGRVLGATLRVACWRIPAAAVPGAPAARELWLYEQWQRIDAWIGESSQR